MKIWFVKRKHGMNCIHKTVDKLYECLESFDFESIEFIDSDVTE